jgi:hypothetical protein
MLAVAAPGGAEVRRVEVVGVVPAGADAPPDIPIREAALQAALAQGVARIARELLSEQAAMDPDFDLGAVLGGHPRDFTVRYQVLEDRGERRALLVADPDVATEYALLVEVFVDVSRIASALDAAGLLATRPPEGASRVLHLVVVDLPSYRAYEALRQHLLEQVGVSSVIPEQFEPGRVDFRLTTTRSPAELLDRLVRSAPAGLRVESLAVEAESVRIRLSELPGALED